MSNRTLPEVLESVVWISVGILVEVRETLVHHLLRITDKLGHISTSPFKPTNN